MLAGCLLSPSYRFSNGARSLVLGGGAPTSLVAHEGRMASNRSLSASASAPTLPPSAPPRAQTPDTRGSRAGSGPARPRTSGTSSTFAQRNRGLGTRSTFGRQVLGGRTSEPSFSFGSAPARIALPAGSQRKGAELQPSVAVARTDEPGTDELRRARTRHVPGRAWKCQDELENSAPKFESS